MKKIFDCFYKFRAVVMDYIMFASIRLYGFEYNLEQVKKRTCDNDQNSKHNLNLDNAKDLDALLTLSKECFKSAIDRRSYVTDKVKTLIMLNAALLAILTAFLPKITELNLWWMKLPFFTGVISLINALIITWMYFDIRSSTEIVVDQDEIELDKNDLKNL